MNADANQRRFAAVRPIGWPQSAGFDVSMGWIDVALRPTFRLGLLLGRRRLQCYTDLHDRSRRHPPRRFEMRRPALPGEANIIDERARRGDFRPPEGAAAE